MKLLIMDATNLAHRAYHSTGAMRHEGKDAGIAYGVLRDVLTFRERFDPTIHVFAFDSKHSYRKELFPGYKANREPKPDGFHEQINTLRKDLLLACGFVNVFRAKGFEADDVIASVAKAIAKEDRAVIVSSDRDMWQLLARNVICYNPTTKKVMTRKRLREEWGVQPHHWVNVKAIAGGHDDLPGVAGVGELTAAKFLTNRLKVGSAKRKAIMDEARGVWTRNVPLVRLPFAGTPAFELKEDEVTTEKWRSVLDRIGVRDSLRPSVRMAWGFAT